jgi:hypothetical protein
VRQWSPRDPVVRDLQGYTRERYTGLRVAPYVEEIRPDESI